MNFRMQWQIQNPSVMMQQCTVRSIFDVFSRIYDDEKERAQTIQGHPHTLLGRRLGVVVEKGVISDGVISTSSRESMAYLLIREVKNEIGTGHSDPYNQASLAYRRYWAGVGKTDQMWLSLMLSWIEEKLVLHCYCILAIAGLWMCVLGGVFVQKTILRPLTDYVWLGGDPWRQSAQSHEY